jgi:alkylation response protein AidB-like acyl-CoA dehydrogenase
MKRTNIRPGGDEKIPHWALADAAAEVDAARLLTLSAAQLVERDEPSEHAIDLAKTFSAAAAEKAVQAALRIEGADGYARAGLLERLSRDARQLTVILP